MKKFFFILGSIFVTLPLLASDESALFAIIGVSFAMFAIMFIITIFFLISQSAFAKAMKVDNELKQTSPVWIWTQLIPIWSLVAIPVTLIKLNEQFNLYINENNLSTEYNLKPYNNTWGWVWYIGSIVSFIFPLAALVSFVGVIGFWIHISNVRKSLIIIKHS